MIVAEMATAGIEGGSLRQIRRNLTLNDVNDLWAFWKTSPPPHIAMAHAAAALGVDWAKWGASSAPDADDPFAPPRAPMAGSEPPPAAPAGAGQRVPLTILQASLMAPELSAGVDTVQASREILRRLNGNP